MLNHLSWSFQHEGAAALLWPRSGCLKPSSSLRLSPDTLQRKLISAACICSLILSVSTESSRPGEGPDSAPSEPHRSGPTPALLLLPHQSTRRSHGPFYAHWWRRRRDTWTPSLRATHWELRPQTWRSWLTSHLASNRFSTSWRSQSDEANRTTSSAKRSKPHGVT